MKILFDHQMFELQRFGGVSRIYYELMNHFDDHHEVEWELPILYSDNAYLRSMAAFKDKLLPLPIRIDYAKRFLWGAEFRGKKILYRLKNKFIPEVKPKDISSINKGLVIEKLKAGQFDIFHPTYYDDYFLDYLGDKPFVLTVYDLIHQIFPEYFLYNDLDKSKKLLQRASKIAAISHSTKKDLVAIFGVDENKVVVTPLGNSLNAAASAKSGGTNHSLPKRYLLSVGNRTEYKNFLFFARLFAAIAEEEKDLHVVCTGPAFSKDELYYFNKLGISDKLHHKSGSDEELAGLYTNALGLIFPSQYEGFGLPVLEAFSCGCPVLAGANSSLLEIGGDAATYFEAKSPASMMKAIRAIVQDESFRQQKISKGYEQLNLYSWQKTAEQTLKIYQEVLR